MCGIVHQFEILNCFQFYRLAHIAEEFPEKNIGENQNFQNNLNDSSDEQIGKLNEVYPFLTPQFFMDEELQHEGLTKLIVTPDMTSRKQQMMDLGDIFLAFPGGIGTLEEISQVMSQVKLHQLEGRFAFLDFNGYYQPMKALIQQMSAEGFVDKAWADGVPFLPSLAGLTAFVLGRDLPKSGETWRHFKNHMYRILDLADDAETGETYVVYKTLYGEYRDFIRPLDMFLSEVDHEKYPDVPQKWRFEKTAGLCSWNPAISSQYLKK